MDVRVGAHSTVELVFSVECLQSAEILSEEGNILL